jgi:hypothetical protein
MALELLSWGRRGLFTIPQPSHGDVARVLGLGLVAILFRPACLEQEDLRRQGARAGSARWPRGPRALFQVSDLSDLPNCRVWALFQVCFSVRVVRVPLPLTRCANAENAATRP